MGISRASIANWPPKLSDFMPLDLSLLSFLKPPTQTSTVFKANITYAFDQIQSDLSSRVVENLIFRMGST